MSDHAVLPLPAPARLQVERLTQEAYAPFGWVIGDPPAGGVIEGPSALFFHAHDFGVGAGGEVELVWATYRGQKPIAEKIEMHRLTEQALIPVGAAPMLHIVAPPNADPLAPGILPDFSQARAFLLDGSRGICMRRGTWHMHFGIVEAATYMIITRRSTTDDLSAAIQTGSEPAETVIYKTTPILLDLSGLDL